MYVDETCDLLIVGGGIAAQAVLSQLEQSKNRIVMVDGGPENAFRAKYRADKSDVKISSRRDRGFGVGGTSFLWGGNVVPFTELELNSAEWPLSPDEVHAELESALDFLGFSERRDDILQEWRTHFLGVGPNQMSVQSFYRMESPIDRIVVPNLRNLPENLRISEGYWCDGVTRDEEGLVALLRSPAGHEYRIRSRILVLANGGLESIRTLSKSTALIANPSQLGRYWSTHQSGVVGYLLSRSALPFGHTSDGETIQTRYLHLSSTNLPGHSAWKVSFLDVRNSLLEVPRLGFRALPVMTHFLLGKVLGYRTFLINADGDQHPNQESRVEVSSQGELSIRMQLLEKDLDSLDTLLNRLGSELEPLGRIKIFTNPERMYVGRTHHLGGARMSKEPSTGIVDANLELHGQKNVYVCSSAVFPTYSSANPTFTLVQLAIRLSRHLKTQLLFEENQAA